MIVTKCDKCGKEIEFGESIVAGVDFVTKVELCQTCGQPVLKFLKSQKFPKAKRLHKKLQDKQFTDITGRV